MLTDARASDETTPEPSDDSLGSGKPRSWLGAIRARAHAMPRWRFVLLLLVPLALLVGREVHGVMTHDFPVEVRWTGAAAERVGVVYERDGEVVQSVVLVPGARARTVRHEAHLTTGSYAVSVEITTGSETHTYRRRVDAPSEGLVILRVGGDR